MKTDPTIPDIRLVRTGRPEYRHNNIDLLRNTLDLEKTVDSEMNKPICEIWVKIQTGLYTETDEGRKGYLSI